MTGEAICYAAIYIIEAFIAWLYNNRLFALRRSGAAAILLYSAGYLSLFFVTQIWDNILVNGGSFFAVNTLLLWICFNSGIGGSLLHAALLTFLTGITEVVVALLLTPLTQYFGAYAYSLVAMIALTVISKLLYFVFAMGLSLLIKPTQNEKSAPFTLLMLSALPFSTVIVTAAFIYIGCTTTLIPVTEWLMIISMIALLAIDFLVLVINNNLQRITQENLQLQLVIQKDETETHMYQLLQTQYEDQRVLIHDIRKHYQSLEGMLRQGDIGDATKYLQELNGMEVVQKRSIFCENITLNTILQQYSEQCTASGVQLNCDILSSCIEHLTPVNITALFSNLLSNACRAAADANEKYIDLTVGPVPTGDAVISVCNSCDTEPVTGPNGLFKTDKPDAYRHGIGLSSISRVVKAYNGTIDMYYNAEEQAVYTTISLPVTEQK